MLRLSLRVFSRVRSARPSYWSAFFFFNDTATTEIYTLSLHDALPIFAQPHGMVLRDRARSGPARSPARALVAGPLPARAGGDGSARGFSRPSPAPGAGAGPGIARAQESDDAPHHRGVGALLRRHDGGGGVLRQRRGAVLPARAPAVAGGASVARRRAAHAGDDGRAGRGHDGPRAASGARERAGRGAPLLRVAGLPALLRGGAARVAAAARGFPRRARGRLHPPHVP